MSKRGQVTIYIIVGIVILAVFSMIFFFRNELVRQDFQSELKSVVIPEQILKILLCAVQEFWGVAEVT